MRKHRSLILAVMGAMILMLAFTSQSVASSQSDAQGVSEQYIGAATKAVPYPLPQMMRGGWLERRLLRENLLRQNDAQRIAYVTLLSDVDAQPIVQYKIQGMVFSLNSQLTTTDRTNDCGVDCGTVTDSPGDNGTWGPEPDGISFFTTEGVQIKWNGNYLETDSAQVIPTKPVIVYNVDSRPSVSAGGVKPTKR